MSNPKDLSKIIPFPPTPPKIPATKKYHAFISYRSVHRLWALQLYDILNTLGFKVFMDQFVLKGTDFLRDALEEAIEDSMYGILIWSSKTSDSIWCEKERRLFDIYEEDSDFKYCIINLDGVDLPLSLRRKLSFDFSEFSEGPQGNMLMDLLYSISNENIPRESIHFWARVHDQARQATTKINAAIEIGSIEKLVELSGLEEIAWTMTPELKCRVAEGFIKLQEYEKALELLKNLMHKFPNAIRPKQLKALVLRRLDNYSDALFILEDLEGKGNRDPETLGILAGAWMRRYLEEGQKSFLRKSYRIYKKAFDFNPENTYVGINAAAKGLLLGKEEEAGKYAERIEELLSEKESLEDYWEMVTLAEAKLILGKIEEAIDCYEEAVDDYPLAKDSHQSTYRQIKLLLGEIRVSEAQQARIEQIFEDR